MKFWVDNSFLSGPEKCCCSSFWLLWFPKRNLLYLHCFPPIDKVLLFLAVFKIFSLLFRSLIMLWNGFLCVGSILLLDCIGLCLLPYWGVFKPFFLCSTCFLCIFWDSVMTRILDFLLQSYMSLKLLY